MCGCRCVCVYVYVRVSECECVCECVCVCVRERERVSECCVRGKKSVVCLITEEVYSTRACYNHHHVLTRCVPHLISYSC